MEDFGQIDRKRCRPEREKQRASSKSEDAEQRTALFRLVASTRAPAGTWLAMEVIVPTLSATPIAVWVQPKLVRKTATKGPKPVWTLATNRFSASSPRPAET